MDNVVIDDLLREASEMNASDLYLAAGATPCINVEGKYEPMRIANGQRLSPGKVAALSREVMSERQWDEFQESLEMNLAYMARGIGRYRINVFWQRGSVAMVCRRVSMTIPTLRSLGLPPVLRNIALEERGILLVTGSTGSGKSTTLASMLDYRNHIRTGHIVTIEDPVEFIYQHRRSVITQREVGIDTKSFHEALKNTLRQAPSVICIGEMRDAQTVQFAMHAAETGHLVFATLHSTNTTLAIERVLHFYPGEMKEQVANQLALNLKAIISQRLVVKKGGGRAAAIEIMLNTPRIGDLVKKGFLSEIREAIKAENQEGNIDFDKALYRLHKQGKITMEDALQAAESANDLQLKFKGIGIAPNSSWTDMRDPWDSIPGDFELPAGSALAEKMKDRAADGVYTNEGLAPLEGRESTNIYEGKGENARPRPLPPQPPRVIPSRPPGAPPPPRRPMAPPPRGANPPGAPPRYPQQGPAPRPPQGPPPTAKRPAGPPPASDFDMPPEGEDK